MADEALHQLGEFAFFFPCVTVGLPVNSLPGIANDLSEAILLSVSRTTLLIKLLWIAEGKNSCEALCSVVLLELHQIQPTESLCCMQDLDNGILSSGKES